MAGCGRMFVSMSAGLRLGLGAGVTSAPNSSCGGGGDDERRSRLAVALGERAARRRGERRSEAGVVLGLAACSISEAVADTAAGSLEASRLPPAHRLVAHETALAD